MRLWLRLTPDEEGLTEDIILGSTIEGNAYNTLPPFPVGDEAFHPDELPLVTVGLGPSDWPLYLRAPRCEYGGAGIKRRAPGAGRPSSWRCRFRALSGSSGVVEAESSDGIRTAGVATVYLRVCLVQAVPPGRFTPATPNAALYVECGVRPLTPSSKHLGDAGFGEYTLREGGKWSPALKAGAVAMNRWVLRNVLTGTPLARW